MEVENGPLEDYFPVQKGGFPLDSLACPYRQEPRHVVHSSQSKNTLAQIVTRHDIHLPNSNMRQHISQPYTSLMEFISILWSRNGSAHRIAEEMQLVRVESVGT